MRGSASANFFCYWMRQTIGIPAHQIDGMRKSNAPSTRWRPTRRRRMIPWIRIREVPPDRYKYGTNTSLVAKKKQMRRKSTTRDEETISPRDPLLNYKKPQLVERLRTAHQQLLEMRQQLTMSIDVSMKREAHIAELEARLAEMERYRTFVDT